MSVPFIMHVDIDAFFAAVEQVLDPELRGRPVIVGGGVEGRGVVASASYEARGFGLRAGMPIFRARELCPEGVFVGGSFEHYNRFSRDVFEVLDAVTPLVERGSMDEAYLDLRGCERLYATWSAWPLARLPFVCEGPGIYRRLEDWAVPPDLRTTLPEPLRWAAAVALRIKRTVLESTGLNVSVGVGTNRLVAKAATDFAKPNGVAVVAPGAEAEFVSGLPLRAIPGIGRATCEKFAKWNIHTVDEARERVPLSLLEAAFGPEAGRTIYGLLRGEASVEVRTQIEHRARSMSRETTFWTATADREFVEGMLFHLVERLGRAMRAEGMQGRALKLRLRYDDFHTVRAARSLREYTDRDEALYAAARRLLHARWSRTRRLRLIGVGMSDLRPVSVHQACLFDDKAERSRRIDRCLDGLRDRFGFEVIRRGPAIALGKTGNRSPQSAG